MYVHLIPVQERMIIIIKLSSWTLIIKYNDARKLLLILATVQYCICMLSIEHSLN